MKSSTGAKSECSPPLTPILKPMKKASLKFPTPTHTQPKENLNETFSMYTEFLWTMLLSTLEII